MTKPKIIIIRTAGTNCNQETGYAFERAGAQVDVVHINLLLANKKMLNDYHVLALPGGFSYGDDISAGKILANQIKYHLLDNVKTFIREKKLIIGICNGFQVLVKAGLLPAADMQQQDVTLTFNDSNKFEDRWVYLKVCSGKSPFFKEGSAPIYLPVAHGEGKFITRNQGVLDKIVMNRQVILKYVDENGDDAGYPWNPNGSTQNIAALCDSTGQVLGMMPHPERHLEPTQHPRWTREGLREWGDGFGVFKNAVDYIKQHFTIQ